MNSNAHPDEVTARSTLVLSTGGKAVTLGVDLNSRLVPYILVFTQEQRHQSG